MLKDARFNLTGNLTEQLIDEHIIPGCGISAQNIIKKGGWDGDNAAMAVGLTIGPTGENIRSACAFGVGFHDNSWTISSTKVWGGKKDYKIALNLKDLSAISFQTNTMSSNYIDSSDLAWYAYHSIGDKRKLDVSEHAENDIKNFCIRATAELITSKVARISYGIVPVSLDQLKREYLNNYNEPGFPAITFCKKEIPFVPLAEDDWELPSPVVPLFVDNRTAGNESSYPESEEIWLKFAQFLRTSKTPNLLNTYKEWIDYLSDNPRFESTPSKELWPMPLTPPPASTATG